MKLANCLVLAFVTVVAEAAVNVNDGVLTVDTSADRTLTDEELFAITNTESTVTKIFKTGTGNLELNEPLDYEGGWEIYKGNVNVNCASNAFGRGTMTSAQVEIRAYPDENKANVDLKVSTVIDIPILLHANSQKALGIIARPSTSNVFTKAVSWDSGSFDLYLHRDAIVALEGGLARTGGGGGFEPIQPPGSGSTGKVIINREKISSIGNIWLDQDAPILCINVETVAASGSTVTFRGGAQVVLGHDRALDRQDMHLSFNGSWTGQLDLNGVEFWSQALKPDGQAQTTGKITSSVPGGILNFYQNKDYTNYQVDIAGYASLVKQGGNLFAIDRPLSSTGSLTVKNGRMAFLSHAFWKGCSGVTVEGGTLEIGNSNVFNRKGTIRVTGGKVLLDDGVVQYCSEFYVNGVRQPDGIYGASGSGVTVLDCFDSAGKGRLFVGKFGLALLIK